MSENPESSSKVLQINTKNVYKIFECNELVVILFCSCYQKPCIHASTFEKISVKVSELYPDPGKVVIGKAYRYGTWTEYYGTSQYPIHFFDYKPNVRLFINGKLATKSFISDITVSNIVSYIQNLLDNSIKEISSLCIPNNPTNAYEKFMIGYFKNKNSPDYQIFKKFSMVFMDDCQFFAGFGEEYCTMYPDRDHNKSLIIFKISNQPSPEFEQEIFSCNSLDYESLCNWGEQNILYSTSEITFDNAEEIQKERPISLILFYNPDDLKPVKRFKDNIKTILKEFCNNFFRVNFLTANGARFSKKLQEIEKSQTDLPFLLLVHHGTIFRFPEHYDITSMMSYQQLKTLIKDFFSNNRNFSYYRNERQDKSGSIHPVYRFNLFCEFSSKPEKIDRYYIPDCADDYFCVSLFDE